MSPEWFLRSPGGGVLTPRALCDPVHSAFWEQMALEIEGSVATLYTRHYALEMEG